jgi:Helix-turn-helix
VTDPMHGPEADPIEVVPVVVISQSFPARPSFIPDIRDFVRRCLADSPLDEDGVREVGETVFRALLDAAGPTGSIQVAFRIFPEHVEVDVLHSDSQIDGTGPPPAGRPAVLTSATGQPAPAAAAGPESSTTVPATTGPATTGPATTGPATTGPATTGPATVPPIPVPAAAMDGQSTAEKHTTSFAEWMSSSLRREGMTQEAAARQLGVSVKTVSRWVGGATQPRMRDLKRIREVFGEVPLH